MRVLGRVLSEIWCAHLPVDGRGHLRVVGSQEYRVHDAQHFRHVPARRSRVQDAKLQLLVRPDEKHLHRNKEISFKTSFPPGLKKSTHVYKHETRNVSTTRKL